MAQINETPPELPATIAEPVRNLVYSSIAKNPADRPASAAHLARAAQSLRRGDVAAAATAVTAVLGTSSLANAAGANYGQTAATRVLSGTAGVPTTTAPLEEQKRRSPWTWPLIALVAILAIAVIAVLIALLTNNDEEPAPQASSSAPTSSTPKPTASNTPSSTPSATPTALSITADDILGRDQDAVQSLLDDFDLELDAQTGNAVDPAPSEDQVGQAYAVDPEDGPYYKGDTITVFFYGEVPTATAPGDPVLPASPYITGTDVTISWPNYNGCPSGQRVTGFNVLVTGQASAPENPLPRTPNQVTISLSSGPGDVSFSYQAVCTNSTSEYSVVKTFTTVAPVVNTPTPDPTPSISAPPITPVP
jgi:serine/threonine-protein kinase